MSEYIKNLGTVMMMVAIANILIPEGSMKKFAALSMGFIMICAAIVPPGQLFNEDDFSIETFSSGVSLAGAEEDYRERVLTEHRENIKEKIDEHITHGSEVLVKVNEEGLLTSVTIIMKGDESRAVRYITQTLNLPRERIELRYENN